MKTRALGLALSALAITCGDSGAELVDDDGRFDLGSADTRRHDLGSSDARPVDLGSPDTGDADNDPISVDLDGDARPEEPPPAPLSDDGAPCDDDETCLGGTCVREPSWTGGYCSTRPCSLDTECSASDSLCASFEGESLCASTCDGPGACREGYQCVPATGRAERVCLPGTGPPGALDGEACVDDHDCLGGTCMPEPDWPGGYCTTIGCETFGDCARGEEDNRCLVQQTTDSFCVRICNGDALCREGYTCQTTSGGIGHCAPDFPDEPLEPDPLTEHPFEIACASSSGTGSVTIEYEIAPETTSYMITPVTTDGRDLNPLRIEGPDELEIDLRGENQFQVAPSSMFGFINPIVVPATPAFSAQLRAGPHRLVVETDSEELCWYLIEETSSGDEIDLNLYLVGVPGIDASSAPDDPNFSVMLDEFESIFGAAGIELGELRYFDVDAATTEGYQVIRGPNSASYLMTTTTVPGDGVDGALSLNVFFVRGFAFRDGSGAIGISMGLPGAAGLHGTRASGVAFTTEFLGVEIPGEGDGSRYTGVVLAHEIGHYLGLFHTSEQLGAGFDPLDDTPECRAGFPTGCPDLQNLMFPFAGSNHRELSDGQAWQLAVNPLSKP